MKESNLIVGSMHLAGKKEYSIDDLRWLIEPFSISETTLRTNLHRLSVKKLIHIQHEGRKAIYCFSKTGRKISKVFSVEIYQPDWSTWDQTWWGAIFTVPDRQGKNRYLIRKRLSAIHFAGYSPGFWVRPKNPAEKVEIELKHLTSGPLFELIEFRWGQEVKSSELAYIWDIDSLNRRFHKGADMIDRKMEMIPGLIPRKAYYEQLVLTGEIVRLKGLDPLLPPLILPDPWYGGILMEKFREWKKEISERSRKYIEKIFN